MTIHNSYFLPQTNDQRKAFPDFEELEVSIEQDIFKHYVWEDHRRISYFTLDSIPQHLPCVNPDCQRGGIDLQRLVMFRPEGEHEIECACEGDEGTPKGRYKGNPCDNLMSIKVRIKKKKSTPQ